MKNVIIKLSILLSCVLIFSNMLFKFNKESSKQMDIEFVIDNSEINDSIVKMYPTDIKSNDPYSALYMYLIYKNENDSLFRTQLANRFSNDNTYDFFVQGLFSLINQDTLAANSYFQKSIDLDSSKKYLWPRIEAYYLTYKSKRNSELKSYLLELTRDFPEYSTPKVWLAYHLMAGGESADALKYLKTIEGSCKTSTYFQLMAEAYYNLDSITQAEKFYHKSLDMAENASSYFGLAYILFYDKKEPLKAKEYFLKSIELDSTSPETFKHLAHLEESLDNLVDAEFYFKEAIRLDPGSIAYQYDLLWFYTVRRYEVKAFEALDRIGLFDKGYDFYKYSIIVNIVFTKSFTLAKESYKIIKRDFPDRFEELKDDLAIWDINAKELFGY